MRLPEEIFQYYTDKIRQSTNKRRGVLADPFGNILWEEGRDAWQKRLREMPDPYNILCDPCEGYGCKGSLRTSCLSYGYNEYGERRTMVAGSGQDGYNKACAPQMPITY